MKKIVLFGLIVFCSLLVTGCGKNIKKVSELEVYIGDEYAGYNYVFKNKKIEYTEWTNDSKKTIKEDFIVTEDLIDYLNTLTYTTDDLSEEVCDNNICYKIFVKVVTGNKELYVVDSDNKLCSELRNYLHRPFREE